MYRLYIKRTFDVFISLLLLLCLAWIWILVPAAVFLEDRGSVFFRQKRVGRNVRGERRYFYILKFRTMKSDAPHDVPAETLGNIRNYSTRVGRILRKSSIDELPQLFNILAGDMSLVGPRPLLCCQEKLYNLRQSSGANDVRPGLTGWAQVHGRSCLTDEEKAVFDGEYAKKVGFRIDAACVAKTVGVVFKGE